MFAKNHQYNYLMSSFRRYVKPWLFVFLGLAWGSLNVLIWFNFSNSLVTIPKVSNLTGYVCSVIPEARDSSNSESTRVNERQSITFDFCVTQIKDEVTDELTDDNVNKHHIEKLPLNILSNNKIKLSIYNFNTEIRSDLVIGEVLSLFAKIKPIHGRINPAGSDYEKWLVAQSYIATGYVKSIHGVTSIQKSSILSLTKQFYNYQRQKFYSHLEGITTKHQFQGLILALSVGEKSLISDEQWRTFRDSGTSHLLAISGLHIGIAALWSYYLVYFLIVLWNFLTKGRFFLNPIKPAMIASITGGIAIALISGLNYPAQRAVLMLLLFFFNKISSRHYSTTSILSIAFILIVIIQPFAILSDGFWLSFMAVSIILLSLSYGRETTEARSKLTSWFRVNLFIFIGLTPISWYFFGQVSIVSLGTNLLLIPMTSFLTAPLVYLGMLSSVISIELASLIFELANKLLELSYFIQNQFALWNSHLEYFDYALSIPTALLLMILSSLFLIPNKFPGKLVIIPIIFILSISFFTSNSKKNHPFKMIVFDIGQGLGVYIGVDGHHFIYDTGYGNERFSMADSVILPFLKKNHIKRLDGLIISHGDSDHRGGLESIIKHVSVDQILSGEKIKSRGQRKDKSSLTPIYIPTKNCHTAKEWQLEDVKFKFINFLKIDDTNTKGADFNYVGKSNNYSCVLSISIGDEKILLTGDIEKRAEILLNAQIIEKHDIIVVPHHGSLTSSSEDFVNMVNAREAIFSTGYANQWKFPKTKVVERYKKKGANIWITHKQGAISVNLIENRLQISVERENYQHFWNN